MMGRQPASQQFDLLVLTEARLQQLDAVSRAGITKLLELLLNECVDLAAKVQEGDDE
jgi:hypothetical protein